jgi:hypothetical protein
MNRQPVFTDIPILVSKLFDPPKSTDISSINSLPPTEIFSATDVSGSLIERVTVSATGDTNNTTVNDKLIYLCVYDNTQGSWSLYKTSRLAAATISDTVPNPSIEWVFTGGILLPNNYKLGIAASRNNADTGQKGDFVAVTVEGSSYTSV